MTAICVIVGTGSIGERHLWLLRDILGDNVMAMPVRELRRAELVSRGVDVVASWEEARQSGVTHAIIATDTVRHHEDVRRALAIGCQVLVEKPLAVDAREAAAMLTTESAGSRVWVACCMRFNAGLQRFRERLPEIGEVHSVRIECQSYLPAWRPQRPFAESYSASASEGGVLRDLIHEIDYAGWLFGWPRSLQARVEHRGRLGIATDEAADLMWEADSGVAISIRLDYLSRPKHRTMRAYGRHGTLEWDAVANTVSRLDDAGTSVDDITLDVNDMYLRQDRAFLEATAEATDERLATAFDGVRALAVCDAARAASERHEETKVQYHG